MKKVIEIPKTGELEREKKEIKKIWIDREKAISRRRKKIINW